MIHNVSINASLYTNSGVVKPDTSRIISCMAETWADRARRRMQELGKTQEDLTKPLGVKTRGAVGHYFRGRRNLNYDQFKALADELRCSMDWLMTGRGSMETPKSTPPSQFAPIPLSEISATLREVPIVGTTQGGPEAFHEELGYPVGIGEGFVDVPVRDPNAYALRVKGVSMAPRMREGDVIVVFPGEAADPGDEVVVKMKNGEVMVKQLAYIRGNEVGLESIGDDARIVRKLEEIEFIHYVAMICPPKSVKYK